MANFFLNKGKGRFVELFLRVDANEPTNSAIILVPVKVSDTEANVQDFDHLEAVLGGTIDEQTEGWSRKTLTDADLAGANYAEDDTNNRGQISIPAVKWTAPTSGKNTTGVLLCYDSDTTSGTDANIIVISHLDFAVTADGNDVEINAGEVGRAT